MLSTLKPLRKTVHSLVAIDGNLQDNACVASTKTFDAHRHSMNVSNNVASPTDLQAQRENALATHNAADDFNEVAFRRLGTVRQSLPVGHPSDPSGRPRPTEDDQP
jgi:hypothetical protein